MYIHYFSIVIHSFSTLKSIGTVYDGIPFNFSNWYEIEYSPSLSFPNKKSKSDLRVYSSPYSDVYSSASVSNTSYIGVIVVPDLSGRYPLAPWLSKPLLSHIPNVSYSYLSFDSFNQYFIYFSYSWNKRVWRIVLWQILAIYQYIFNFHRFS